MRETPDQASTLQKRLKFIHKGAKMAHNKNVKKIILDSVCDASTN